MYMGDKEVAMNHCMLLISLTGNLLLAFCHRKWYHQACQGGRGHEDS